MAREQAWQTQKVGPKGNKREPSLSVRAKVKEAAKNLKTNHQEPLHVYGPIGLQVMTVHIQAAQPEDIRGCLEGLLILYHQLFY